MNRLELKEKIKSLSAEIKQLRSTRKEVPYGYVPRLEMKRYDARHYHIAASLLRGRTMEQIEVPSPDNKPNMSLVERIMKSVEVEKDEVVCNSEE
jgi:hypothetical protein